MTEKQKPKTTRRLVTFSRLVREETSFTIDAVDEADFQRQLDIEYNNNANMDWTPDVDWVPERGSTFFDIYVEEE
jgi:hypothetical protein